MKEPTANADVNTTPDQSTTSRPVRRWRRRLFRLFLACVVLAVVARFTVPLAVPWAANLAASSFDLTCTVEDLQISVLNGSVQVRGVQVAAIPTEGEEAPQPYLDLEFAEFDLDVSALFALDLRITRLEADGIDLVLERTAEGKVPLLRHFEGGAADDVDREIETLVDAEAAILDLTLPLQIDSLRAQHVRVRYVDDYVAPSIDTWLDSSIRVSGLGREEGAARISIHTYARDLLDSVTIEATAWSSGRNATAAFDIDVRGVHPIAATGWLRELGLEPAAEDVSLQASGRLEVTPHPTDETALVAHLDFNPTRVEVDGAEQIQVEDIQIEVPEIRPDGFHVALVAIDGVRAQAWRTEEDTLRAVGLELGAIELAPATPVVVEPEPEQAPGEERPIRRILLDLDHYLALPWRFDEVRLGHASLVLHDETTGEDVELVVQRAGVSDLVFGEGAGGKPVLVVATASSPGVVGEVRVQCELWPTARPRRADIRFDVAELTGGGLDPYLALFGVTTDYQSARATGRAAIELGDSGDLHELRATVSDLNLSDGGRTIASLDTLAVRNVVFDRQHIAIESVEVSGGRLPLRRDADGALCALGMRMSSAASPMASEVPEPGVAQAAFEKPAAVPSDTPPLRLELGALAWSDIEVAWHDETANGTVSFETIAMDGEVFEFAVGGAAHPDAADVAKLRARVRPAGLADELVAEGTLTTRPGVIDARIELDVRGSAISWQPLLPYFGALGIVSGLVEGELRGSVSAGVRVVDGVTAMSANLTDFELAAGDSELASLRRISVEGVEVSDSGIHIASVTLDQPAISLARRSDDRLDLLGLLIDPAARRPSPVGDEAATVAVAATEAAEPGRLDLPRLDPVGIDLLVLRGATLRLRDESGPHPTTSNIVVDASLRGVSTVPGDGPATIEAVLRGEGFLGEARFTGQVEFFEESIHASGAVAASGLQAGPLASYLPPGITVAMQDGRADFSAVLRVARSAQGGLSLEADLGRVELRDGGTVLAGIDAVRVNASRIDPAERVFLIDEVRLRGAELGLERTAVAAFRLGGLELDLEAMTNPAGEAPTATSSVGPGSGPQAPARATDVLPTVVLGALDLEFERLSFVDRSGPRPAQPVLFRGRLSTSQRMVLLDPDPEALEPFEFAFDANIDPFVAEIHAALRIAPWRADAELGGDITITGMDGSGLHEVVPELAALLRGTDFDGGTFTARMDATLRTRRKSAVDIDLARGFGAEVEIRDVALRGSPDGDVLLGVDALRIDARQIHPQAGMHFTSVEIDRPRGRVLRDADGLHVAGLVFADPLASGAVDAEGPHEAETAVETPLEPVPDTEPVVQGRPFEGQPDFRIDQLLVQGIDFEYRDVVSEPAVVVPIVGLDVEVARFSTTALGQGRPVKFTAVVQGGDVELPRRYAMGSLLGGVVDSTATLVSGEGDEVETEKRPIFIELATHGRLSIHPALDGRVRTSLEGLELTSFRGMARQNGVDIGDGVLDAGVELRFEGQRVHTQAGLTFSHLVVDEEPGGPISTYLKLPAPLQTVLFVMKDSNEQISLPVNVSVDSEGIGSGQILTAAVQAMGTVIATSVAESPLRVAGGVGGLLGLGGGEAEPLSVQAQTVEFAAATANTPKSAAEALAKIVESVGDDEEIVVELRHVFGAADLARADLLANPEPAQALALVARLRQRRDELIRRRAEHTAEARVANAIGDDEAIALARDQLRALTLALGETEDALDRMLEFTRPNADKRRDRRARATAIDIARQRLESVRLALIDLAGADLASRIEVRRPSFEVPEGIELGTVVLRPTKRKQD